MHFNKHLWIDLINGHFIQIKVKVLYDFTAESTNEITTYIGEELTVLDPVILDLNYNRHVIRLMNIFYKLRTLMKAG